MSVRGATDAFSRSPLSLAFRPFIRPTLKGSSGSRAVVADRRVTVSEGRKRAFLGVEPQEVVLRLTESADGCVGLQATMWPMQVVAMEPAVQLGGSLI
jgi:hypothetical protein